MEEAINRDFLESITDPAALYENAPCGYLSFTADGRIVKINQTLLGWLGYQREEIVHKMYFKDVITKGGQIYYEMFYFPLLLIQNLVNEISFDYVRKDGTRFPALVNSNVVNDNNGKLLVVNTTIFNISDRKKYESELLEAKKNAETERSKFESLADFLPELVWTANADGLITYVNKRFAEFFSMPFGSLSPDLILSKIHVKDRFKLIRCWAKALRNDDRFQVEVRIRNKEDVFQWYLIRALANEQVDGDSKWMGSCTNIDQHVTVIQQLDEFVAVASHELKTPITSLKASLQLIQRLLPDGSPLSRLVDQSNRAAQKISGLVKDLLNAKSIKEGQVNLNYSRFAVFDLLSHTTSHLSAAGSHKSIIDCPPDLQVNADEHRIEQVLVNFINNAIKYAPDAKNIYLIAEKEPGQVRISVRDTGPGIPADKLPYLFDRYYRASHSGSSYSGLGLGLYICAEIIHRHKGKIGVESTVGSGTTFWFTLPI